MAGMGKTSQNKFIGSMLVQPQSLLQYVLLTESLYSVSAATAESNTHTHESLYYINTI